MIIRTNYVGNRCLFAKNEYPQNPSLYCVDYIRIFLAEPDTPTLIITEPWQGNGYRLYNITAQRLDNSYYQSLNITCSLQKLTGGIHKLLPNCSMNTTGLNSRQVCKPLSSIFVRLWILNITQTVAESSNEINNDHNRLRIPNLMAWHYHYHITRCFILFILTFYWAWKPFLITTHVNHPQCLWIECRENTCHLKVMNFFAG